MLKLRQCTNFVTQDYKLIPVEIVNYLDNGEYLVRAIESNFEYIVSSDYLTDDQFNHLDRMQARVMVDQITFSQWLAETESERTSYYNWLRAQCGEFADLI